ncbi:MAG: threonylcarbamoyl-AMP synthase [Robiginitomaculum sp.]|nr:threonylcarbamoyl-AMP synthase [Robiginitomaculum sp.]
MAEILKANLAGYQKAARLLMAGELVALPTETVYGLAALASHDLAVQNVYNVKNRELDLPVSICVFFQSQAEDICHIPFLASQLMRAFWPGPLTLVLPKKGGMKISKYASPHLSSLGIRCPDIAWINAFTKLGFSSPLVLTSANISGNTNAVTAQDVNTQIGKHIPLILDGGPCKAQQASSVIAIRDNKAKILRAGALTAEDFAHMKIDWQA